MRAALVACLVALALGGIAQGAAGARKASCPGAWAKGWQVLANKVQAPVYCPTWMPNPLDAKIGGDYQDAYGIGKDRSYLVSFLEHGDLGSGDVHVNFRGFPGRTVIPRCPAPVGHGTVPCFSDPGGHVRANRIRATVYRVNQGEDQWHILLAWRYKGTLYTVSQHVINPYDSATKVLQNMERVLKGLVLVKPAT
ncbi:MAG TPA: hypothetical protein VKC62_05385 [Gaiellaceae bacterium]|nr:hypothetical protein [Gaiellaceae bacterium]